MAQILNYFNFVQMITRNKTFHYSLTRYLVQKNWMKIHLQFVERLKTKWNWEKFANVNLKKTHLNPQ